MQDNRMNINTAAPTETRRYGRKWTDHARAEGIDIGEPVRTTKTTITLRQTEAQRDTMRAAAYQDLG